MEKQIPAPDDLIGAHEMWQQVRNLFKTKAAMLAYIRSRRAQLEARGGGVFYIGTKPFFAAETFKRAVIFDGAAAFGSPLPGDPLVEQEASA